MKAVIQRVESASVSVEGKIAGACEKGFMLLFGAAKGDTEADAELLARKTANLRVFCDENGKMTLRRGFVVEPGQKVLIVEDVVTTGGSVKEVIELVKAAGGDIVGVGSIVDRTGGKIDFGVPFKAVYSADVTSWEAADCPLCKAGELELVKPGSRKIK